MPSLKNPKADLKRLYHRSVELSVITVLILLIVAFSFAPKATKSNLNVIDRCPTIIDVYETYNTIQKEKIPPPPKAPEIIAAAIDDVPEDIILPDIDDVKPVKLPDNPPRNQNIDLSDEEFIPIPEELPQPIGGLKAIQEKVHFTEIARRAGVEGTVFIEAKINKEGNVVDAAVKKGLGAGLDEEALNAVLSTKFIPGKQRGKPVNVKMVIPIKFVLK